MLHSDNDISARQCAVSKLRLAEQLLRSAICQQRVVRTFLLLAPSTAFPFHEISMALRSNDGVIENFPLVLVDRNASVHDRRLAQHYARAHTARVNRRKHRDDQKHTRTKSASAVVQDELFRPRDIATDAMLKNNKQQLGLGRPTISRAHSWPIHSPSVPHSLAPVFGGLTVSSFDPAVTPDAARVADFCRSNLYPPAEV